jgi:hypothetical protein
VHSRSVLVAAIGLVACGSPPSRMSVGPAGGLVSSEDDTLTLVFWPGALGEYVELTIVQSAATPESFGPAYEVTTDPPLAGELGIDVEVIIRGDLPEPTSLARVGAIDDENGTEWTALPLDSGGINVNDDTVRGHDDRIARYYALLDDGGTAGTTTDESTSTETTDSGDPTGPPRSFAADVQPIFDANCIIAGCHGPMPAGDLSLDTGAYENLVGVQAFINGSLTRVIAGDWENSFLMRKLDYDVDPTMNEGNPMPTGGQLPEDVRDVVRQWIDQGCPP